MVVYDSDSDSIPYSENSIQSPKEAIEREAEDSAPATPAQATELATAGPISSPDSSTLITTPKKNAFFDVKNDSCPLPGKDFAKLSRAWEASKAVEEIATIQSDAINETTTKRATDPMSTLNSTFGKSNSTCGTNVAALPVDVSFRPTAPELEIETGFAARVYAELIEVKKQVQQLQSERHQLRTCRRKAQRELQQEKKKYQSLLQSNGTLHVHRKKVKVAAHLGAYAVEEDKKRRAFRPTGVNYSPKRSELRPVKPVPPPHERDQIHSTNGRIVSETARILAYKRRLADMHRELKILTTATDDMKSKPAYKKYERLTQLTEQLQQQANQLRDALKKKTKADSAKATAAAVQRSKEEIAKKDVEIEELKVNYKEVLERVRKLQSEVTIASQKVEAQTDTSEKLLSRVDEARSAAKAKREGLPEEKKRLTERLKSIEEHISLQTEKLKATKLNGERELEEHRGNLKKCSNLADHLKSEYEERERALERDREVVKKMRETLRVNQSTWCEEVAILQSKCKEAESAKGSGESEWMEEKKQLEQRIASLKSELQQIEDEKAKCTLQHHQNLVNMRTAAEARETTLRTAVQ